MAAIVDLNVDGVHLKQIVCSGYHASASNNDPVIPPLLLTLIQYCQSKGLQLVYGFDANAHNTVWGSKDTDRRDVVIWTPTGVVL